jgi:hypothetical protein
LDLAPVATVSGDFASFLPGRYLGLKYLLALQE